MAQPEPLAQTVTGAEAAADLRRLFELQRAVLGDIALGADFEPVIEKLCLLIEAMVPGALASVLVLDPRDGRLYPAAAPSFPPEAVTCFQGLAPRRGYGSCASAAECGEPVFVQDAWSDPRWEHMREAARALGLRACWSIPIRSAAGEVAGTFAITSMRVLDPSVFHRRLLEDASFLAGIALRHRDQRDRLLRSERQLHRIADTVPGAVYQCRFDAEGRREFLFLSRGAESLWGLPRGRLTADAGEGWPAVAADDAPRVLEIYREAAENRRSFDQEFRINAPDGPRWLRESAVVDSGEDGPEWNGIVVDVTASKNTEARLAQWAAAVEGTSEGVIITDHRGRILDVNRAFSEITGYSREEVRGRTPIMLRSGRHPRDFYRRLWAALKHGERWQGEIWNRRKDGEVFPEWMSISPINAPDGAVSHYVAVFADLSPIKESEAKLAHLAHHDPLTGLPNRLLFGARLEHALERARRNGRRVAVMFLDLDRFKNINDSLGHARGDELIQAVAQRLSGCARAEDTVARQGGDEFTLVLEDLAGPGDAGAVAAKLLRALDHPFQLWGREVFVTASIGISLFPRDGGDAEALVKNADAAMYRAKERGRNNYAYYTPELTTVAEERFNLESGLRLAVQRAELVLYFQPQVDAAQGRIVGVEALLRWRHPVEGMIGPDRFIPVAEETGLIHGIGLWSLRQACRQARAWHARGLPALRVAVNLSGFQIIQAGLGEQVAQILEETGLDPSRLELEITESFAMSHAEQALEVLAQAKALGVGLAIDDFGVGYSSLAHLKRLPVHTLKIDRSLVRDIPDDPNDAAIARAVVAMGHSLGLKVIAEGVETGAQRDALKEAGCDGLQGYLYGRPMPADAFERLLELSQLPLD